MLGCKRLKASSLPHNETAIAEGTCNNVKLSELTLALGELRVAIAEDFKAAIAKLDAKIMNANRTVASQGQSIVDVEKAAEFNAGRLDELEKLWTSFQESVQRLSVKVVDLEGRSRHLNLRLGGLAEGGRWSSPYQLLACLIGLPGLIIDTFE